MSNKKRKDTKVTAEYLDNFAKDYYNNDDVPDRHLENLVQIQVIPKVMKYIHKNMRVLEMGFGDGVITPALEEVGVVTDIVEGSSVLVERAKAKHPKHRIFHSMFEEFRPAQPYDAVLCFHVLEHVQDVPPLLNIVKNWLKKDGLIIGIVPNAESIHRQLAVAMGLQKKIDDLSARDAIVGHLRVYTLEEFKRDFEQAGMKVEAEFGNFLKTLPNSMMLDYSDELLKALCNTDLVPPKLLANIGVVARRT
ncbi:MAG: class I SAM-dependent methyltransferase [Proteobacteria bacterium]|nr:class I SAM-dependent methyltransferase [Pseudomonadota bacterium]